MNALDPVCHVEVATEDTKFIAEYRGRVYYFDTQRCLDAFESNPEAFAAPIPDRVYDEHGDRLDGSD